MNQVVTNVNDIFEQGNLHMSNKLRHFTKQGQDVVKYIISRLRKYNGNFFESYSTIADATNVSTKTVQRVVKRCEQLDIFVVSSRKEETLEGKMRTTTNKIQLLAYESFELIKEVVEVVRTVVKKVKEKVSSKKDACETRSKESKPQQARQSYTKKPVRVEQVPTWLNVEYVKPQETDEIKRMREILMKGGIL